MCYLTKNNTKDDQNILSMVPTEDRISGHQIQGPRLCYCSATVLQSNIVLNLTEHPRTSAHHTQMMIQYTLNLACDI